MILQGESGTLLSRLRFLPLGPSRPRGFPGLLFALFVCKSFGRRFTSLAAQLYRGGVLLGHELSITVFTTNQNGQKVPERQANRCRCRKSQLA